MSESDLPALNRLGVPRLTAVDLLRGLVIVLMVLDHVRDFFHVSAFQFDPLDPTRTHAALYLTRWITHLCAPTFVFLAGVSAYLQRVNGRSNAALSRLLLTRGAWLLVLEVTVIGFGFNFAPFLFLQVIWAIGLGMILLAGLVWLRPAVTLFLGVIIVAGHGLVAALDAEDFGVLATLWMLAFEAGVLPVGGGFLAYPAIPWTGVMCLGYGLGRVFTQDTAARRRSLLLLGGSALALFFVLRALNGYGDPRPWTRLQGVGPTLMSFFDVSKYPPSLLYVLVTLGTALTLLPLLERVRGPVGRLLVTFGRTPLFTYVAHIYVAHGAALLVGVASGFPAAYFVHYIGDPSRLVGAGWGFSLATVYVAWLLIVAALYPAARWFAALKSRRRDWWLAYL